MKRWSVTRLLLTLLTSALVWAGVALLCMLLGTRGFGWPHDDALRFRREMVLLSSLIGASLAAAGVAYQSILRNPLADPYLLGVSSGAALFAYLWQLPALTALTTWMGTGERAASQQMFAFAGAIISVAIVLIISNRRGRLEPVTLLLVGVIINALNGSIYLLIYHLVGALPTSEGALGMIVGGIKTSLTLQEELTAACVFAAGFIMLLAISGQLNAAALTDTEAQSLGVRIQRLRWLALIIASLITAAAVAISGPIGFIGLICPHLARLIVGSDQRRLLPLATAFGAALLAIADASSRGLAAEKLPTVLPVGVLTSLLGGPFFLLLLLQSRRRATMEAQ